MISVFFSYSHKDEGLRDELEKQLSILKRQGTISTWHDRRITAGSEVHEEISDNLKQANIILLLVSADFLASDYCWEKEMMFAIERHNKGEAVVIPVILRPCNWTKAPFGKLLATPKDGKPVTEHTTFDKAFAEISKEIERVVDEKFSKKQEPTVKTEPVQTQVIVSPVRTSNLRIRKEYTDYDRNKFMNEAYEYIATFFENSLAELEKRNPEVSYDIKRLDAQAFSAVVFVNGKTKCTAMIYFGGASFTKGINYSREISNTRNSLNESLSVDSDGYKLFLKNLGFASFITNDRRKEEMTFEGAAEFYWEMFIEPLQRHNR